MAGLHRFYAITLSLYSGPARSYLLQRVQAVHAGLGHQLVAWRQPVYHGNEFQGGASPAVL